MDPVTFQRKWIGVELKERSASQEHFLDLCRVLGHATPAEMDPTGDVFTFERGASKLSGGEGWADVWYRGHFAWEYKGRRADLKAAYDQLNLYRESLENPPLLVVSDLNKIEIHTNFTGTVKQVHLIDLSTFAEPASQRVLRAVFTDPESLKPGKTRESVTREAAERFSQIAIGMHARGVEPHRAAHYLVQLLFCLFAEDVELLPNRIFSKMVAAGVRDPGRFDRNAAELLTTMNTGGSVAYEIIPRFNGGLFATVDVPGLTVNEIRVLHDAAGLDWSSIEPSIFGTLFERSLDPSQRAQLGAHYTGRNDIERVVEPVVIAPIRRRWEEVRSRADTLKQEWDAAQASLLNPNQSRRRQDRRAAVTRARNAFAQMVADFQEELTAIRILDPACGSGNFLYVALDRLLDLEKEVLTYRATNGLPMGFPAVRPHQVMGLEINEYAQQLAQVAIWIGYLQWMIGNSFSGISEPVLDPLETIRLQDALLDFSGDTVKEATWPEAAFIIGNPPFLGGKRLRSELNDTYVDTLFAVYRGRVSRESDLCCYFFEKARAQIEDGVTSRAGLLATNSIRGGANRDVLQRIKRTGNIFMAWSDEPWILNGAAVRISIVGFDRGEQESKVLNGVLVPAINSDLTSETDITHAPGLQENRGIGFQGGIKAGPFDVEPDVAMHLLSQPINPNGRSNADVVRPYINGADIVRRPRNVWVIDFGVNATEADSALYEAPFEYVREHVFPVRATNRDAKFRSEWWLHGRPRPELREATRNLQRVLVTPRVSKYRLFTFAPGNAYIDSAVVAFARDDDYFFGVLHSRAHEVWSLRMGTWLGKGNDPRYTPTTCFETFPLPWTPGTEPVDDPRVIAIGEAAKRLSDLRETWLNPEGATETDLKKRTLTNLYNARPQWLTNAHDTLDRAVWAAYGWDDSDPSAVEEDTILSRLLALNQRRASATEQRKFVPIHEGNGPSPDPATL
jgi:type II restriction/modification system DNA methylase subunit YeeA